MPSTPPPLRTDATISLVLTSARIRYALILIWGLGLAAVVQWPVAMLWTLLTLLAGHTRTVLERHEFGPNGTRDFGPKFLAIGATTCGFWAAAPLIAWYSGHPYATPVAMLYLAAGYALVSAQLRSAPKAMAIVSSPYSIVAAIMLLDAAYAGAAPPLVAGLAVLGLALAVQVFFAARVEREVERAQAENRQLIEQLQLAVESMSAAPWDMDFRTETLRGGDAMAMVYGRALSWADVNVPGTVLGVPADRVKLAAAIEAMTPGAPRATVDHRIHRADGGLVWLRTAAIGGFNGSGRLVRLSGLTYDVTAEKRVELEVLTATREAEEALAGKRQIFDALAGADEPAGPLPHVAEAATLETSIYHLRTIITEISVRDAALTRMIDDLARARNAAESANLAKSQFLANMSHELRTPLNAIIGYGELLRENAVDRGDADADADLRRVLGAAQRLLHLINDVLDLSKIEAGRMEIAVSAFPVASMLEEALATVEPMASANGNVVRPSGLEDLGDALTDRFKLSQCVLNLLSNAAKFTRRGEVRVEARREARAGEDWIVVAVADTGVGIAPDKLERLFQPFVQADASMTRVFGGTGLGLSITRHLARLLGGDVTVTSTDGQGSTFTLAVPAAHAEAAPANVAA